MCLQCLRRLESASCRVVIAFSSLPSCSLTLVVSVGGTIGLLLVAVDAQLTSETSTLVWCAPSHAVYQLRHTHCGGCTSLTATAGAKIVCWSLRYMVGRRAGVSLNCDIAVAAVCLLTGHSHAQLSECDAPQPAQATTSPLPSPAQTPPQQATASTTPPHNTRKLSQIGWRSRRAAYGGGSAMWLCSTGLVISHDTCSHRDSCHCLGVRVLIGPCCCLTTHVRRLTMAVLGTLCVSAALLHLLSSP